jgi:GSH-dependent disulfide-bond oxidoreductase
MIDPDGPDGKPISIFESGAILLYLARKCGRLLPLDERGRSEVEQWLMFQVGGLGPMCGQYMHFHNYAPVIAGDPDKVAYGVQRYKLEVDRLCGVMNQRLKHREFLCAEYSIADIASWPWVDGLKYLGVNFDDFPPLKAWRDRIGQRPAVARGMAAGSDIEQFFPVTDSERDRQWRNTLFKQSASSVREATKRQDIG